MCSCVGSRLGAIFFFPDTIGTSSCNLQVSRNRLDHQTEWDLTNPRNLRIRPGGHHHNETSSDQKGRQQWKAKPSNTCHILHASIWWHCMLHVHRARAKVDVNCMPALHIETTQAPATARTSIVITPYSIITSDILDPNSAATFCPKIPTEPILVQIMVSPAPNRMPHQ